MLNCIYGKLVVVDQARSPKTGKLVQLWVVRCHCGSLRTVDTWTLTKAKQKSCGKGPCRVSSRRKHGLSSTHLYRTWSAMKGRCTNVRNPKFYLYGKKGIKVCARWQKFEHFAKDMGERPSPNYSLGRIDGKKDYMPGNVRWETRKEQQSNIATNRHITFKSQTMCVSAWARTLGLDKGTLAARLRQGWPLSKALSRGTYNYGVLGQKPPARKIYRHKGKSLLLSQWAKELGVPKLWLYRRRDRGLSVAQILDKSAYAPRQKR